jgi:hypothetical protein
MAMKKLLVVVLFLGLVLAAVPPVHGQAVSGTITGYVYDPSEAGIADAAVTITNVDTGIATTRTTDATGRYVNTNLSPGTYTVAIEVPGFQRFLQQNVVLTVDSTIRVDPVMQLGAVTETVTITAAPPMLKSEKTDVGAYIPEQELQSLPALGNNLSMLYNTVPGVIQNMFQIGVGENPSEFNATLVNGMFFGNSEYELDGITDTAYGFSGFQVMVPNQDSIGEMKITTAAFDPEFGSSAGMVAQFVTKSGTNDLHGSAFWYNRNSASFAADPFTEKIAGTGPTGNGTGPSAFNWNQFGGSAGGPFVKNRVFWFTDHQRMRSRSGATLTATVPNDQWRAGILNCSQCPDIFDPLSGDSDGSGRTQFPDNTIPQSRVNPVATNLMNLMPRANLNQGIDVNFIGGGKVLTNSHQTDFRLDAGLSNKDTAFARYSVSDVFLFNPSLFGRAAGGQALGSLSPQTGDFFSQHFASNWTHTFSPNFLTEVRGGVSRFTLDGYQADAGLFTNDEVGIPNINTDDVLTQGLAGIDVRSGGVGAWWMGILAGVGIPRIDRTTTIQLVSNSTFIKGSHQIRFGVDVRRTFFDFIATNASSRGNFQFAQSITGTNEVAGSGMSHASFLLGMSSNFNRAIFRGFTKERNWRTGIYWQDTWRATPKLTINYGFRWDYLGPVTAADPGGLANFDPGSGDILLSGLGDVSGTANVSAEWGNISPRFGLAYKLTDQTVIRAGFGRSYFSSNYGGQFYQLTSFFPIVSQQTIVQANQRFPIFPIGQGPPAESSSALPDSGHLRAPTDQLLKHRPFNHPNEYVDSWNIALEHQFAQDWKVSVAWVGNVGRHLWWQTNMNAAIPGPGNFNNRRQLFPQFGISSGVINGCNCANSSYNALQWVTEKRFNNGYMIKSAFTWAKALDGQLGGFGWGDQGVNPHDRKGGYGLSPYNRATVWTLSHSFELPFGKGKRFGSGASGALDAFIGGWQFHGITIAESGFAISPTFSGADLNADFGQKPNRVGDHNISNSDRDRWFDSSAFSAPAPFTWGNAGRGIMRGPGLFGADWSFWKQFNISEGTKLQFRWENFNMFNHANLANPNTNISGSTVGQIFALAGSTGVGPSTSPMRRMQFGLRLVF